MARPATKAQYFASLHPRSGSIPLPIECKQERRSMPTGRESFVRSHACEFIPCQNVWHSHTTTKRIILGAIRGPTHGAAEGVELVVKTQPVRFTRLLIARVACNAKGGRDVSRLLRELQRISLDDSQLFKPPNPRGNGWRAALQALCKLSIAQAGIFCKRNENVPVQRIYHHSCQL